MKIEAVRTEDSEELLAIYAPYVRDTAISFERTVPTLSEFRDRIAKISSLFPYIKAVDGGEILGYAYANKFKDREAYDRSVEVTIYVRQDCRRQGVGRHLYEVLEKTLLGMGILNMNACIAITCDADEHLTNDSLYFHEKMGFRLVGTFHNSGYKFGTWYDMIWMEKIIGEHTKNPDKVRFGEWTVH